MKVPEMEIALEKNGTENQQLRVREYFLLMSFRSFGLG